LNVGRPLSRFAFPAALLLSGSLRADTVTLTNGRVIEADRAWFQGSELRYEKNGGVYGLPRSLVLKLEQQGTLEQATDPDIVKARERLRVRDPLGATQLLGRALSRDPQSMAALHALTEAYLALGNLHAARATAQRAIQFDARNARSRALLGDALAALGDREGAEAEYRRSLVLQADPEIERKLSEVAPAPVAPTRGAQFRIRYDGSVNEPMGLAVLGSLDTAYGEYSTRLGFHPTDPVTVVLQTEAAFQDARTPDWAAGINDGTIRVAVRGLDVVTPRLTAVLRHELAHSFVATRTGGNCPTWLQEGISQWLEGGDPSRQDAELAERAKEGRLHSLLSLEGPFQGLEEREVYQAYAESLSAVAHILRKRGEAGLVRLLAALADGLPSEEALPVSLALSYPELQKGWEDHLRSVKPK
jgi:tetratricopeptide (TPR) repeat protein